jgi:phenylpropionate dioxygenase-like ring-hydroxylating dioxygenase large terminal subunit
MPLSPLENERLTRVERGALMGRYLRANAWFPAAVSSSLIADDAPMSLRLLGEDFVVFRATDGRVAVFAERCPHRGASLLLARTEDNALRCIFHGWKFRVDGTTVEAPTQSRDAAEFCRRVPLEHFPTREAVGVVWVWLGAGQPGPLPRFDFLDLSGVHVCPVHSVLDFNWLQALEGLVDSAHVSILHQDWLTKIAVNPQLKHAAHDAAPIYEFEDRGGGFRYAAIRRVPDGRRYVRITEFVGPWYSFTPGDQGSCFACVPIDDSHTAFWSIRYDRETPIQESPWKPPAGQDPMHWPPPLPGGRAERWGQDRGRMRAGSFSGFGQHFFHEDVSVAASQGAVAGREREFLNAGDEGVFRLRRFLLRELGEFESGRTALPPADPGPIRISAGQGVLEADADWRSQRLR